MVQGDEGHAARCKAAAEHGVSQGEWRGEEGLLLSLRVLPYLAEL